ncbi:MAG: AMIN domain-containing protein, partial [Chromatiaceae bacterium]
MKRFVILCCLLLAATDVFATEVAGVRLWTAPDHTRLVFDISSAAEHKVFALSNPDRLVVDLAGASMADDFSNKNIKNKLLRGIRH